MKLAKHLFEVFNKLFEIGYCTDRAKNKEAFIALVHSIADDIDRAPTKEFAYLTDDSILILQYDVNGDLYGCDPYEPCSDETPEEG